jgi:hypothetical protein
VLYKKKKTPSQSYHASLENAIGGHQITDIGKTKEIESEKRNIERE